MDWIGNLFSVSERALWEIRTTHEVKTADFKRGKRDARQGFWPEEDATYWYMDGYKQGEKDPTP